MGNGSFLKVISKCMVAKKYASIVSLHKNFSEEFPTIRKNDSVTLQIEDGSKWVVGVIMNSDGNLSFRPGWGRFVSDNNIKLGDTVVFDYIGEHTFLVKIFSSKDGFEKSFEKGDSRESENNETSDSAFLESCWGGYRTDRPFLKRNFKRRPRLVRSKHIMLEFATAEAMSSVISDKIASNCACFVFVVKDPDIDKVEVECKFAREYLPLRLAKVNLYDEEGETWPVRWAGMKACVLTGGWRNFVHHHKIQAHDICLFQLKSLPKQKCFKVKTYRLVDFFGNMSEKKKFDVDIENCQTPPKQAAKWS